MSLFSNYLFIKEIKLSFLTDLKKQNRLLFKSQLINARLESEEQLSLNNSIAIVGLPILNNDKLFRIVQHLFSNNLNVNVDEKAILNCYQKKFSLTSTTNISESESKINNLIRVKFNEISTKNNIMKEKRNLKITRYK